MDDLIERLRNYDASDTGAGWHEPLCYEAADALAQCRAELSERKAYSEGCDDAITALRAEVERLRGALEKIAQGKGPYSPDPLEHAANTIKEVMTLARAALGDQLVDTNKMMAAIRGESCDDNGTGS